MPGKDSARIRWKRAGTAAIFLGVAMALSHSAARAQSAPAPKRVLVLYWYNKDWPSNAAFGQSFQAVLQKAPLGSVEYYAESLETDRFPGENQAQLLHDYLRQKYADRRIDVIVAVTDAALDFFLRYRRDLFPNAPIVFVASRVPTAKELAAGPGITGVLLPITYRETVDLALRLHPDTQQVFVISGTLEHDKLYEMLARQELEDFQSKADITYLTDLSPDELVARTQSLPDRSVVLYIWQQVRNDQGTLLESRDVLDLFARTT